VNPLAGCVPTVPTGEKLTVGSPEYVEMEKLGTAELPFCGFVLVAGGLGERLGYNGYSSRPFCSSSRALHLAHACMRRQLGVTMGGLEGMRRWLICLSVAGIKVALPLYIVEREMCFLELYLAHIASMQRMHGQGRVLPIAIMTSDDTHDLTVRLLADKAVRLTQLFLHVAGNFE
jgi:UDP-sugar pyrophosphorylase